MSLPSPLYYPLQGIQTYFVDKLTGLPLSAGYLKFYKDINRSVEKDVYQQVQLPNKDYGFVSIGSDVPLSSVGTTQSVNDGTDIQVYLYPYDENGEIELYFMEVYSNDNVLQFTREAIPSNVTSNSAANEFVDSPNQISNSQFVDTLLPPSRTYVFDVTTSPQITNIAPDWYIESSGVGTITVTQQIITDATIPTGAPFAINITSTGVSSVKLIQRITESPRILGTGFINGSLVAASFDATVRTISMDYIASNGYSLNLFTGQTTADSVYTRLATVGSKPIESTNSDGGDTGYVEIVITIPALANVGITSVQIVSTESEASNGVYIQESTPRQIDHLFHYYKPELEYKPIPSYLVGWDFPLNPVQQYGATVPASAIGANKSKYVWDQTILFQTVDSGMGITRGDSGEIVVTAALDGQAALIQYLPQKIARKILNDRIAVNIAAKSSNNTVCNVSLWYTKDVSLPDLKTPNFNSLITTIDANAIVTAGNGTWFEVPRSGFEAAKFTAAINATTNFDDYSFSGWSMDGAADVDVATYFAIVISTEQMTAADTLSIYSVGLCSGDIATRPAAKTLDEVLRECEYYYETSKDTGVPITSSGDSGALIRQQAAFTVSVPPDAIQLWPRSFGIEYHVEKRVDPSVKIYSEAGLADNVTGYVYQAGVQNSTGAIPITNWTAFSGGLKAIQYVSSYITTGTGFISAVGTVNNTSEAFISFHYEANSQLGVVL